MPTCRMFSVQELQETYRKRSQNLHNYNKPLEHWSNVGGIGRGAKKETEFKELIQTSAEGIRKLET